MEPKQSTKPARRGGHSTSPSTMNDPKASPDYQVKPIFKEPSKLYGREHELQLLKSAFHRLVGDAGIKETEEEKEINIGDAVDADAKDVDDSSPTSPIDGIDQSTSSKSSVDTESSADYQFVHRDSLADATATRKRQTKSHSRHKTPHLLHYIKQKSDISLKYESTLLCHAPHTRECIFLYGPQGMGKRSLAKHALEEIVSERGGWFICGEFERDYFDRGGGRSRRRSIERGKSIRGVRFEDEKSNDDDEFSSTSGLPLSGVIAVCREICARLLRIRDAESEVYDERSRRSAVMFNLSHKYVETVEKFNLSLSLEEKQLLTRSLGLSELIPMFGLESKNKSDYYEPKIENVFHHKKKLHYAFQKFISVVSRIHGPLVICFNNFQFADDASLDLLEAVLFDREIGMIMLIGCIRLADQAISAHESANRSERMSKKLYSKIEQWCQADIEQFGLKITDIELNNLSIECTKEILIDMLSVEDKRSIKDTLANLISRTGDITALVQLCYEYSHGNTYFLTRFMEILYKKKLLFMDRRSDKWCWDLYDVASVITTPNNVVDVIVSESVNKLPKQAKSMLLLAACMGNSYIDEEVLHCLWNKFERKARSNVDSQSQFRLFVNESLYRKVLVKVEHPEREGSRAYRWSHESMIKALSDHVDVLNISNLRYEVGATLDHNLTDNSDILVIAKLVNSGGNSLLGSLDSKTRVRWAEKNLIAAKRAVLMSAFDRAAQYAEAGIEYLPSSMRWKEHCDIMIELSSILGEVAGAISEICNSCLHFIT